MQRAKFAFRSIEWGTLAHLLLSVGVPLAALLFIRLELVWLAAAVVLASKWRVVAVAPRHWLANFRTNSPDLIVNLSFVILLINAETVATNAVLVSLYILYLIWLKPKSSQVYVGLQSLITVFIGLCALFWLSDQLNEVLIVVGAWLIALGASRHFLSHFEEPLLRVMSLGWAMVVAELVWLSNRWLIVYAIADDLVIPQAAIIVALIGYIAGTLYLLAQSGTLRRSIVRNYVLIGCLILLVIVGSTDWNISR